MRILHTTDLHANERQFRWVAEKSREFDLVCITGDLLDLTARRPVGQQLKLVIDQMRRIETPLALCSGNHDSLVGGNRRLDHAQWLSELRSEKIWCDGDSFAFDGYTFRCIAWMTPARAQGPNEIWLAHAPPEGAQTAITRGGAGFGDFGFAEECKSGRGPRLALSGHIHDPVNWWARMGSTTSINPGFAAPDGEPNHAIINLRRGIAELIRPAVQDSDVIRLWPPGGPVRTPR